MTKMSGAIERVHERLIDLDVAAFAQSFDQGAVQAFLALPHQTVAYRVPLRREIVAVVTTLLHAEDHDPGRSRYRLADGSRGEAAHLFFKRRILWKTRKTGAAV